MNNKLDGLSMDLENANMEKLKSVFPECFAEGKLDIDKLLYLCGEYIDNDFEKYKFEWKGKSECLRLAQKRSTGTLRPCREESVNFDDTENVYIEGDNLEVLKLLQTAYYNKIKMIYIDPPYNTGNDFVYEDDFADPMARYKEVTQQTTKSNPETMGRYHTNWLNMMYPRLRLAANLLRDDGVIFISIDDNEVANLRKVCDEVFGEENFVCEFIWKSKLGKVGTTATISSVHEYIICYGKCKEFLKFKMIETSNDGRRENLRQWGQADRREDRPSMFYPIVIDGIEVYPIKEDGTEGRWRVGKDMAEDLLSKGLLDLVEKDGRYNIYRNFEAGTSLIPYDTLLLDDIGTTAKGSIMLKKLDLNKIFDFSKPLELVKHLLELCTRNDDIILDFFSGSATTAHAVMQLNAEDGGNRKFIMVQLPELCDEKSEAYKAGYKNICEIGKERIRRAGKKTVDTLKETAKLTENKEYVGHTKLGTKDNPISLRLEYIDKETGAEKSEAINYNSPKDIYKVSPSKLDIGFKVFKLDTSNLKLWDNTPITGDNQITDFTKRMNSMIYSIKDDRTDMDVVYEVMLKMGVPLDVPVQYIEVNGKIVYIVGEFLLMIALFDNITAEDIESIAAYAPAKIICAESSFKDDSALSNAHYILRDKQIELKLV